MDTGMIPVREELRQRAQAAATQQGESVEALVEAFLEAYLEELDDIAVARERMGEVRRGESQLIPWDEVRGEFLGQSEE